MRILMLANIVPYPARGGIHLRIFHLLKRIAEHHDVTLACHMWDEDDRAGIDALNAAGIHATGALLRPWSPPRNLLPAVAGALRGVPPEVTQFAHAELHAIVQAGAYDLLHVEETILTPYVRSAPKNRHIPKVLTLHNIHFDQGRRIATVEPTLRRRAWKAGNAVWMRQYEPRVARLFDRCVTVSETDRELLLGCDASLRIEVVPNGVDTHTLQPLPEHEGPPSLLLVGSMLYRPCADAAIWLVQDILPRLRARVPDLQVWIVGRGPTPDVLSLAGAGVHIVGTVSDVTPWYQRATVAAVPLRAGGGSRLKILEAMALGRAVVSTTLGAEGLHVRDSENIVLADDAEAFANATLALLRDGALRTRLVKNARSLVEREYDWNDIVKLQLGIYDQLAAGT